jgi:hypothetical protein
MGVDQADPPDLIGSTPSVAWPGDALQHFGPPDFRNGSEAIEQMLHKDRNPLKADMVSWHPRADRMVVILGNRGVRPCQTLTILLHQSDAHLGTRAS